MAIINLDAEQLKSLNTEIGSLDQSLLQSYLPQLENELGQVRSNVQNAELNSILNTISSQFTGVKSALSTELPKLETFLDEQIQSYATTEQEAAEAVNAVVSRMQQLTGNTKSEMATAAQSNAYEERLSKLEGQLDEANKSNWTKANEEFGKEFVADGANYGSRVADHWSQVGESFSNGEIVGGVGDIVGATVGTLWDTGGLVINEVANGVDWAVDQVFGTDGLVGKIFDIF